MESKAIEEGLKAVEELKDAIKELSRVSFKGGYVLDKNGHTMSDGDYVCYPEHGADGRLMMWFCLLDYSPVKGLCLKYQNNGTENWEENSYYEIASTHEMYKVDGELDCVTAIVKNDEGRIKRFPVLMYVNPDTKELRAQDRSGHTFKMADIYQFEA